jgi:hypothetical protein
MKRAMGIEPMSEGWETCAPNSVHNVTKKLLELKELPPLTSEVSRAETSCLPAMHLGQSDFAKGQLPQSRVKIT